VAEVNSVSNKTVVISSERLADLTSDQLQLIMNFFSPVDIELLLLYRPVDDYVKSMWRHAVFRHDLSESFEVFRERFKYFNPTACVDQHRDIVPVHAININDQEWEKRLYKILGTYVPLLHENISAPFSCCCFLQQLHRSVGSEKFKKFFTSERKKEFSNIFTNGSNAIEEFTVPIINQDA